MYFNKKIQCTIVVWLLKVWHISVPGFSLLLDTEDLVEGLSIFQTDYPGLSKLQTDYPRLLKLLTNYQGLSKFLKDNQAPSGFKTDCQWPFGLKAECQRLYEVPDKIKGLFRILEKLFADIDNCASLSPSCTSNQGLCKYKEGTNFCSCESGWKVSEDNGSCVDINECFNLKKPCPGNTFCENTIGSYSCTCGSGLILGKDKASCVDIDECKAFSCPCSNDEECVNLPGGYSCNCKNGFRKEQNICVARCNKTCDIATSKCILADGLESCQCNAGYSKIYTNNDDILCVPNCSQICDAVKAQCIVEHGVALCKCKVEYGIGSGLASDGNNSCSHYIIGNKPTVIQKGNFIALIPELPREYLVSFDIYPNAFTSGWHNVVLFTDDSNTIKSNNGVLGIWFHVNGNGELYISPHLYGNSNGFVSKSLGLNMWSSIEISQVLNGSVYDYTVKINKKIVFSQTKQSVQSFKFVRVFASSSSNNAQDGLIKNFYFITNNQNTNYNPIVIPLKDSSFDNIWTNYNQLMYLKIDKNARQIKPIYGDLDKHKEAQGFWFSLPSKIVVVIDNLHKNVNMVLSAVGYAVKGCILLIRFDKYKKEPIKLKSGVFYDFKLHYGINDLDFARFNLNIESSDCNFTKVYLFSANIAFEDINECTSLVPPCSWSNGVCENTYGSYLCKCANGWKIEGKSCLDIDECTAATFPCPLNNGMCENTMGSYICKCESGWMLNGNICIDINECNATTSLCSWGNGLCQNTNGSFFCSYLKEFQNNSSFAYALVEDATPLFKGNGIALIPKLNREFLLTFNIFLNKINGWRSVICFSLDSGNCELLVFSIQVDPDGSLVFIKKGHDHYNKFKHPISERKWINIEINQFSTIRKHQYKYTIKINKIDVLSVIIQNKHEYDNIRVLASDSFHDAQDCLIEKFYFINGKTYNELYLVVILPKGLNLKNAWIPDDGLYWSRFQNINEKFIEKVAILDYNVLGFWATKNERLEVFIDPLWINLASISFNFRLSIISYALRPSNLFNYIMDADQTIFYSKNIELINNSFVTSEIVLTFDQYKEIILFDIGFYRVNNNPIYLISVNASLEDINECNDTSPCPWTSSECENTFGSYLCKCKIGFLINKENDSCFDINECNDTSRCPWTNSECENTFGSYLCKCKIGFLISKENDSCVDINECNDTSPCPWTSSECENTFGSYLCKCKIGFLINKENDSCFDINECNDTSRCPWTNSECENTFGSYLCKCKIGFLISKENDSCVDINECHNKTQCPWTNAVCLNTYGSYLCKCENGWKLGEDNASCIDRTHSVSASVFKVDVSILVPVLLILIILVVVIVLWIQKRKEFQPVWLNQDPNALDIYLDYQKLKTDEWEILPSNIIFGKKIGEGAFGNVFIAKITAKTFAKTNHLNQLFDDLCDIKEDSTINVAVKLLKDGASDLEYNDFVKEITLMKGIGYHKNIVNMIGCCTFGKYLCLVNEFMENGDLLHFLRNTRIKFISLNDDIEAQVRFIYTHTNPLLLEKTKLMQNEIALMDMEPIKSSDLLSFAWQIASGMEYLSCIKLVHRDLAARNILVGAKKNLKISDFGLTCKLNDEANYTGKTNRRLPIKWMSVEAIFYRLFTTFSDVWSYGVVLFEIVTLGGTPYSTISNGELLPLLKSGYRMERPDNCSQTVYDIMLRCWNQDPLMRPTFTELRELFEKIMSHGDRYVSLDIDKESAYYNTNSSSSSDKIDESKQEEVLLVVKPVEEFKNIDSHVYSIDDEQHKICFSYMLTRTTEQPKKIVIKNLNDLVLELRN
ncbi:uncharacterized protein LOC136082347 isoform X2 [Hydra vulgaris]|uniref:Uncharacterized protein LOC136082347 isoform X2 n=1 Tax=Hydra vulgaris TaxID=6087 RepID=A0ABM4C775_HYDVU